ncbi:MAG: Glutamyl-tRNA(Gln) amidotransferase subunit A [candidate division WS6 bacterium OLB20]|uniref:Glutamyl-tRNA(Gln) amidotransferase subunit A n=1 Tax=candidate division WS6 bacterium OLB20 TaxID=1617426 RepID=A0A136LWF9_9BACT|nr:MAG: Glutamyl-tRNA(Gln) amidotransferase subunit A [candidate division WS6 bacterium OLB20]
MTISETAAKIRSGELKAVDLAAEHLKAAHTTGKELNAFITVIDQAIERAKQIDEMVARGEDPGVLAGIPCTVKDVIMTKDIRTTASSRLLENFIAPYSATAVERIEAAGAVIIGKTNSDPFAFGGSGENSGFGPALNPLDRERVPGGSSSGAAAAQAAGIGMFALGTDTGGSVRQPSAFVGVTGFKPTYGRNSRYGLIAMASSFDTVGVLGNSVEDVALVEEVLAGKDSNDATTYDMPVPAYSRDLKESVSGLRIAVPEEYFSEGIEPLVEQRVEEALEKYRKAGATVERVSLPILKYAIAMYYVLVPSEISSNMARYDGVRFGHKDFADYDENLRKTRGAYMEDEVKRRVMIGTYALSAGYADQFYNTALKVRVKLTKEIETVFKSYDLIAGPTAPSVAFKLGELVNNLLQMYLSDIYTVTANLTGCPAISIPCGMGAGDMPVGLQLMAKRFDEQTLFNAAHFYQTSR